MHILKRREQVVTKIWEIICSIHYSSYKPAFIRFQQCLKHTQKQLKNNSETVAATNSFFYQDTQTNYTFFFFSIVIMSSSQKMYLQPKNLLFSLC